MAIDPRDRKLHDLFVSLSIELIRQTPRHFKEINCDIIFGMENGVQATLFNISCPQFPNESSNKASDELVKQAKDVVRYWLAHEGSFPGVRLMMKQNDEGRWSNTVTTVRPPKSTAQPKEKKSRWKLW